MEPLFEYEVYDVDVFGVTHRVGRICSTSSIEAALDSLAFEPLRVGCQRIAAVVNPKDNKTE